MSVDAQAVPSQKCITSPLSVRSRRFRSFWWPVLVPFSNGAHNGALRLQEMRKTFWHLPSPCMPMSLNPGPASHRIERESLKYSFRLVWKGAMGDAGTAHRFSNPHRALRKQKRRVLGSGVSNLRQVTSFHHETVEASNHINHAKHTHSTPQV